MFVLFFESALMPLDLTLLPRYALRLGLDLILLIGKKLLLLSKFCRDKQNQ